MNKASTLRDLFNSPETLFLMEAHNGLSAKIVEKTGFKAIWGSGLAISAQLGARDNNEASWTQVLEVLEFMSDGTSIPILLDGDTGYGNFNNMRRLVQKLEQRGIAGVCIEDKIFPKTNSFINGEQQPLCEIEEFMGKIKAAKDIQANPDFMVVARVEAFIAGWGLEEALRRAEAYQLAGADALLIHSKLPNSSEIDKFMQSWKGKAPIVIVPTKYFSTPTEHFEQLGVKAIIWANQTIRTSAQAMQKTLKTIFDTKSIKEVEQNILPLLELFALQDAQELLEAENLYLPKTRANTSAIILAASQGKELGELTASTPKAMLTVQGKPIVRHTLEALNNHSIRDISIVTGFMSDSFNNFTNVKTIENTEYANTKELYSLFLAREKLQENVIISYGDIVFKDYFLTDLLQSKFPVNIAAIPIKSKNIDEFKDLLRTDKPYSRINFNQSIKLLEMSSKLRSPDVAGEFVGLTYFTKEGCLWLREALDELSQKSNFRDLRFADLFNFLTLEKEVHVRFIEGPWFDIDRSLDLVQAGESS